MTSHVDTVSLARRRAFVLGCLMVFVCLVAASMCLYPGGTWWDPGSKGHAFWQNFLCDLLHNPALNHQNNALGARLATLALLVFVLGLAVFWSLADAWSFPLERLKTAVKTWGVGTTPLLLAVPLLPSNRFAKLHTAAVVVGGVPALLTLVLAVVGFLSSRKTPAPIRAGTASLALLLIACLALYIQNAVFGGPSWRILPMLERILTIGTVLWMVVLVHRVQRGRAVVK